MVQRETQRRLDQYQQAEPENRFDPIIDQFIHGKDKLVRVVIEDIEAGYLQSKLDQIINARGLRDTIKTSVVDGVVYLEKDLT